MGCWNETCGVTQLPITEGSPIRLFLISYVADIKQNHAGHCYSNAVWSPRYLPVKGNYDDYGGIDQVVTDWNCSYILSDLQDELTKMRLSSRSTSLADVDDDEDDDDESGLHASTHELDLGDLTIESVVEAIQDNSLCVAGSLMRSQPTGYMMVHEWVWQHMTRTMHRDWQGNLTREQVFAHGVAWYTAMQAKIAEIKSAEQAILFRYARTEPSLDSDNPFIIFGRGGQSLDAYGMMHGIDTYKDLCQDMIFDGEPVTSPLAQQIISDLSDYLIFHNNMSAMRKTWMPQAGKGSQQNDPRIYLAFNKVITTNLEAQIAEWADEDGDDDEEESACE